MKRALAVVVVLAACQGGGGDGLALTGDLQQQMLDAHNRVRAAASDPVPQPALPPMTWSDDVAAFAADWASSCLFQHNPNLGEHGENLAFFSAGLDSTPDDVVDAWFEERVDYDYENDACTPGAMCGHYTQLVWRDTVRVGCARAECTVDGFDGDIWVCDYEPPGNFVGERPY